MMLVAKLLHLGHTSASLKKEKRRIDARKDEGDYGDSRDAEAVSAGTE
jgi:hypothetical protein